MGRSLSLCAVLLAVATVTVASPSSQPVSLHDVHSAVALAVAADPCSMQLGFAEELERKGEFYRAVTEYLRYGYSCPGVRQGSAELGTARCLLLSGAYEDLAAWGENEARVLEGEVAARMLFLAGIGRQRSGHHTFAADDFRSALKKTDDDSLRCAATLNRAVALAWDESYERAISLLEDDALCPSARTSRRDSYTGFIREALRSPRKSRRAARILGIVPGLGHAYAEHWQTALVTVALVALGAWGTAEAVDNDNHGTAALLGFVTLTFYTGSVQGSGEAADRRNEAVKRRILGPVQPVYPQWATEPTALP